MVTNDPVGAWPLIDWLLPGYLLPAGLALLAARHPSARVMRPVLSAWLRENGAALDHVLLSRPDVAEDCLPTLRAHTRARISYYGHDLHFRRMHQQGEHLRDEAILRAADRMEERERDIWRQVDAVLYPSEEEARVVRLMTPAANARAVLPYPIFNAFLTTYRNERPENGENPPFDSGNLFVVP